MQLNFYSNNEDLAKSLATLCKFEKGLFKSFNQKEFLMRSDKFKTERVCFKSAIDHLNEISKGSGDTFIEYNQKLHPLAFDFFNTSLGYFLINKKGFNPRRVLVYDVDSMYFYDQYGITGIYQTNKLKEDPKITFRRDESLTLTELVDPNKDEQTKKHEFEFPNEYLGPKGEYYNGQAKVVSKIKLRNPHLSVSLMYLLDIKGHAVIHWGDLIDGQTKKSVEPNDLVHLEFKINSPKDYKNQKTVSTSRLKVCTLV